MSKGFLTIAYNSITGNYLECAEALAYSLKLTQTGPSGLSVMVPRGYDVPARYEGVFDHIIPFDPILASTDNWNAHLKWQAFEHSPYDETILTDADMLFPTDVSYWWDYLATSDLMFSSKAFTYKGMPIDEATNPYRTGFRDSHLPNVYTTLMYFKKTDAVKEVFDLTGEIIQAWPGYRAAFLRGQVGATPMDDLAFACAVKDAGYSYTAVGDSLDWFSFVHLKSRLQRVESAARITEMWTNVLNGHVVADGSLVLGGYLQSRPVHYHDRRFLSPTVLQTLKDGYDGRA